MPFDQIFANNQRWVAEKLATDPNYFKKLSKGQAPEYLYIGCSDSRVMSKDVMGLDPGSVFVHRNIANMVVSTDMNINAVIQYAVEILKVKHIIVAGHYECGGVKAALNPCDLGQLNSWLQTLRDVRRLHREELEAIADEDARLDRLVELNVREQCINIIKMDHVQRAWCKTGYPSIHGWVFDVRTGLLKDLGIDFKALFEEVRQIYDLNPPCEAETKTA